MKISSFASRFSIALALGLAPALFIDAHAATARLTVYKSGGSGKVTSSPSGINCGSDCTGRFTIGSNVTLTAAPSSGYEFAGWYGACSGTSATTTLPFNGRATCTATFRAAAPQPSNVTLSVSRAGTGSGSVTSAPAGISCGSTCSASYASGTAVTLTAAPASGSTFNGWSGACTGTASTASVTMTAAKACTATFNPVAAPAPVTLSVSKSGTGSGTVTSSPAGISCGSTCSAVFAQNTTVTLTAAAASGSVFAGWSGNCAGTGASASVNLAAAATCSAAFSLSSTPPPVAGAYYVATTGSDTTGTGTSANPWKTIGYGISRMAGGDTLIVKNGVYTGKANFILGAKSGTASRPTVIMAETPTEVRIQSNTSLNYRDNQVLLSGNYIKVDGFIFDMSVSMYPPHIGNVEGSYNTVSRSIFKRSGDIDAYGGLLSVYGSYNLVEDVAGVGACRYCFEQGSPDGVTQYNVWRRVVGRFDYSNSSQPKRTITTYGNDSGTGVSNHLYQNVIALDGNDVDTGRSGAEPKYSAIGVGKQATNVTFDGAIVLNEVARYAGIFASVVGTGNKVTNSVVWDMKGGSDLAGVRADKADTQVDRMTIGGLPLKYYYMVQFNSVTPSSSALGGSHPNLLQNSPGATITKRMGVSGTRWGEAGFDQPTSEDLWPWPHEAKIKQVFAEANNPPAGNLPASNNTKRGFAADGNGKYGGPITLTSYIWEYLGTPCPSTICR